MSWLAGCAFRAGRGGGAAAPSGVGAGELRAYRLPLPALYLSRPRPAGRNSQGKFPPVSARSATAWALSPA